MGRGCLATDGQRGQQEEEAGNGSIPVKMKEQRNSGFFSGGGDSTQRENEGTSFKTDILK